jgi:baculoviral IAP repeat-containing protein 6
MTDIEFHKWIKNKTGFTKIIYNNNIHFNLYQYEFILIHNSSNYFTIETPNNTYEWINKLNIISIQKNITLDKFMTLLYNKVTQLKNLPEHIEIEIYNKQKELESYIKTSFSPLTFDSTTKINQIFNSSTISMILIEEFMDLYKKKTYDITLVNNNLFHWKILYSNFSNNKLDNELNELKKKHGYAVIEIELLFHDKLYPNYPPNIKIIRPRLNDSLMYKIANCKMVQLDYWTPSRTSEFIIHKIKTILNKNASIDIDNELNDIIKYPNGSYLNIEQHLVKLSSYIPTNLEDNIDDEKYKKTMIYDKKNNSNNKYKFTQGIGYGNDEMEVWDINLYIKSQEERDIQIKRILTNIVAEVKNFKESPIIITDSIKYSFLIPYIKTMFYETNLLEISKHSNVYKIIFELLLILANEHAIFLFHDTSNKNLFDYLEDLYKMILVTTKLDNTYSDEFTTTITQLYNIIKPLYENYIKKLNIDKLNKNIFLSSDKYIEILEKLKFDSCPISSTNYYYQNTFNNDKGIKVNYQKRLLHEYTSLQKSLPVSQEASIFMRVDDKYNCVNRVLMTGPKDTPYEGGCFIFDTYICPEFPNKSPKTWFLNHGGKRFNPNLYDSGKVCLSLLGTWKGQASETWNYKTSTLYQLYMSIQSQILVEQPYFNEPSYERYIGTNNGNIYNKDYNDNIRYYTMCHAIYDLLQNPKIYPQFEDIIKYHFYFKKDKIIEICTKWTKEASSNMKLSYENKLAEIINSLDALKI